MELYGSVYTKVNIDPLDVIEKLKDKAIGSRNWVFEKNGKFYRGFEVGLGSHSIDDEEEISKEKYDFIQALKVVETYLKNEKTN